MINFVDISQNTDEWFNLRAGRLTSSKLGVVMANFGKAFGEPAKKYAANIALEQITGVPTPSEFSNEHMERGHEEEPIAREIYESEMFCDVLNGGFFQYGEFVGCSPDGLIGDRGICEIKSVIPSTHYANIARASLDPAYKWQCIGNLMFTGREWLDFISYCGAFPEGKKLFIHRIKKHEVLQSFEMIAARVSEFERLVDSIRERIETGSYFVQAA